MIYSRNIAKDANILPSQILGGVGFGANFLSSAPRPSGDIAGQVYYVHPDYGSNNNDGLSPDAPLLTLLEARTRSAGRISWSGSPWANQDAAVLFPGIYDETSLVSGLYGLNLIGLGNAMDINGEMGVTIQGASGSAWNASSFINGGLFNICFQAPADDGTEAVLQLDTFNRMVMEDCVIQGTPAASASTLKGFEIVKDMTGSVVRRLWINQCIAGIYLVADNANSKQITSNKFEDIDIMAATASGIYLDINCVPSATVFRRFTIGPTPTLGVDDNSAAAMFNQGWVEASGMDPSSGSGHYNQVYVNGTLYT